MTKIVDLEIKGVLNYVRTHADAVDGLAAVLGTKITVDNWKDIPLLSGWKTNADETPQYLKIKIKGIGSLVMYRGRLDRTSGFLEINTEYVWARTTELVPDRQKIMSVVIQDGSSARCIVSTTGEHKLQTPVKSSYVSLDNILYFVKD